MKTIGNDFFYKLHSTYAMMGCCYMTFIFIKFMFTLTNDYYTMIFIGMYLFKTIALILKINQLIQEILIMTKVSMYCCCLIYYMIFLNFLHDNFFASDDHRDYVDVRNQH